MMNIDEHVTGNAQRSMECGGNKFCNYFNCKVSHLFCILFKMFLCLTGPQDTVYRSRTV